MNLVRQNGTKALTGHYMADSMPLDMFEEKDVFVVAGEQRIHLSGSAELKPGDLIGVARAPFVEVSWDDFHEERCTYEGSVVPTMHTVGEDEALPASLYEDLIQRLDKVLRAIFRRLLATVPPHLHDSHYYLQGPGWTPAVIDELMEFIVEFESTFSKSKSDLGHYHTLPFVIHSRGCATTFMSAVSHQPASHEES